MIDSQGRVIDHSAQDRTTSEGQSYAMFFALVDNDRIRFDKLLNWTEVNLAGGDLTQRLPAWSWGKSPDGSWKILDQNPAADADLWIAYSLLEAGTPLARAALRQTRHRDARPASHSRRSSTFPDSARRCYPVPSAFIRMRTPGC